MNILCNYRVALHKINFLYLMTPRVRTKIFLEAVYDIVWLWNFSYFRNRLRALPPPQPEHVHQTINRYTEKKSTGIIVLVCIFVGQFFKEFQSTWDSPGKQGKYTFIFRYTTKNNFCIKLMQFALQNGQAHSKL